LISYNTARVLGGIGRPNDPNFDPYSESFYLHDNTYIGGGTMPPASLGVLVALVGLPVPQIVVDGDVNPVKLVNGTLPADLRTCIQETAATFVNLNVPSFDTTPQISRDIAPFNCSQPMLSPIAIAGVQ
jgi:hypothetical protein